MMSIPKADDKASTTNIVKDKAKSDAGEKFTHSQVSLYKFDLILKLMCSV